MVKNQVSIYTLPSIELFPESDYPADGKNQVPTLLSIGLFAESESTRAIAKIK